MTDDKIAYAKRLVSPGVSYTSEHPDFQDIVVAARVFPAALRLAEAAQESAGLAENIAAHIDDVGGSGGDTVRVIAETLNDALTAFLALLPEPPEGE